MVDDAYPSSDFAEPPITVPTVNPERTFLEKLFLLHEEFQRPAERVRTGDYLSRHLYDIVKVSKTSFAEKALLTPELYQTIVAHRCRFNPVPGVDYSLHKPQSLNPVPIAAVLAAWEADYKTMREEMIYDLNAPSFEQLMVHVTELK